MQGSPKLLRGFVQALCSLPHYQDIRPALEESFSLVASRRPDLLSRGLFAERGRDTVQTEIVLREALKELKTIAAGTEDPDTIFAPDFYNLRFNHATGRLHVGHGSHWVYVFPAPENDKNSI
jgi:hypothetical protein